MIKIELRTIALTKRNLAAKEKTEMKKQILALFWENKEFSNFIWQDFLE